MPDQQRVELGEIADDAQVRTHLANERTFLAWLRTAIVLIGAGIAATALTETEGTDRAVAIGLGTLSVLAGCGLVVLAYYDFRDTQTSIENGRYRPSRALPMLATVLIALVGLGALVFAAVELDAG